MAENKYYICTRTLSDPAAYFPIAGPFDSRAEAAPEMCQYENNGWSDPLWSDEHGEFIVPVRDLRDVVETIVVERIPLLRGLGFKSETHLHGMIARNRANKGM